LIVAGDGGSVTQAGGAGTPGLGGSVSDVAIKGLLTSLSTGLGGTDADGNYAIARNGSVAKVSANQIGRILAGNNYHTYNAVAQITGLKTSVLGFDAGGDFRFTWSDGSNHTGAAGFTLAASGQNPDFTQDGLVIVAQGGFAQSAKVPLLFADTLFFV
jgi:hypothetical protein